MSAIEASSVRLQTMADGTLRVTCDVEPRHAQSAFALFGSPGTPMALAALKTVKAEPEKPKGGPLSQWAAMRCQDPTFCDWLARTYPMVWAEDSRAAAPDLAADVIRVMCGVQSRAELDNDSTAAALFDQYIRGPWQKHCRATGATA